MNEDQLLTQSSLKITSRLLNVKVMGIPNYYQFPSSPTVLSAMKKLLENLEYHLKSTELSKPWFPINYIFQTTVKCGLFNLRILTQQDFIPPNTLRNLYSYYSMRALITGDSTKIHRCRLFFLLFILCRLADEAYLG